MKNLSAVRQRKGQMKMNENMDYRRFKIINEQQKEAFENLVADKNLNREDLLLILTTVTLNKTERTDGNGNNLERQM